MGTGHEHPHPHEHERPQARGFHPDRGRDRRRLALALCVVSAIMVAEIVGGIMAHSLALLSDAGHMFSDVVAQALALAALVWAARPADARRTYGWHRLEILAALGNGLALLALAGVIFWEGFERLRAPVPVQAGIILVIAGIGLVANVTGAALLHGSHSLAARGAFLHIVGDALSSLAVLAGGAVMLALKGAYWLDPALSILIGFFVLYSGWRLLRDAVDVLLETVPRGIDLLGVTQAMRAVLGVSEVHDLHIWTITSGMHALSAHVVIAAGHDGTSDDLLRRLKEVLLREYAIAHTTLQIETVDYEHVEHVC